MRDEPVWVQCHRCTREFWTYADTRTTCTCRAAVTVPRDGESRAASDSAIELPAGIAMLVAVLVVVGTWLWRGWGRRPGGDPQP
jgi:hypothetical protein